MQIAEQEKILQQTFPFLKKEDIAELLEMSSYRSLANKTILISAGQNSSTLFFILKGMIRGFFINEKGEEKNVFLRPAHTITGAPESLFKQSPTKYTFEAVTDTKLLLFNYDELLQLGYANQHVIQMLFMSYHENIQTLIYRVESMIDKAPEERYEALLARSPQFFEQAYQKHVANYLGITAVSLSRIIKRKAKSEN